MPSSADKEVQIRTLAKHEEFQEAVQLQREIWGFRDVELLPLRLFIIASKIGGQVLGAFHGQRMVAFCLCIPGLKPTGKPYLHSHMLGVANDFRNLGLGRELKLHQREYAMAQGVDLIEWTFDPLELKNAFFNIERLGAVARRYTPNQYGATSSHLHGGLPTDRLTAEWWIKSPRVRAICDGGQFQRPLAQAAIPVPANISQIRRDEPSQAIAIQTHLAEEFEKHFAAGLAVTGFQANENEGTYLLSEWKSE